MLAAIHSAIVIGGFRGDDVQSRVSGYGEGGVVQPTLVSTAGLLPSPFQHFDLVRRASVCGERCGVCGVCGVSPAPPQPALLDVIHRAKEAVVCVHLFRPPYRHIRPLLRVQQLLRLFLRQLRLLDRRKPHR